MHEFLGIYKLPVDTKEIKLQSHLRDWNVMHMFNNYFTFQTDIRHTEAVMSEIYKVIDTLITRKGCINNINKQFFNIINNKFCSVTFTTRYTFTKSITSRFCCSV